MRIAIVENANSATLNGNISEWNPEHFDSVESFLRAKPYRFEVVIIDYSCPGRGRHDIAREIRASNPQAKFAIIEDERSESVREFVLFDSKEVEQVKDWLLYLKVSKRIENAVEEETRTYRRVQEILR